MARKTLIIAVAREVPMFKKDFVQLFGGSDTEG